MDKNDDWRRAVTAALRAFAEHVRYVPQELHAAERLLDAAPADVAHLLPADEPGGWSTKPLHPIGTRLRAVATGHEYVVTFVPNGLARVYLLTGPDGGVREASATTLHRDYVRVTDDRVVTTEQVERLRAAVGKKMTDFVHGYGDIRSQQAAANMVDEIWALIAEAKRP